MSAVAVLMLAVATGLAVTGCTASTPVTSPTRSASTSPAVTTATPPAAPARLAALAGCPPARPEAQLTVVARIPASPDDVTVDRAGNIWVTALDAHLITELSATGEVLATVSDPGGPEGLAELPDGHLVVADQVANALGVFHPGDAHVSRLLTLANHTANAGVDGIGFDAAHHQLLIPDSPNGTLLAYSAGGGTTVLRRGLGRPVTATTDPAGNVYIGMENAPGVLVVSPSGTARSLGSFSQVDEVVYLNGLLYIADLAGTVDAIDPATGQSTPLVTAAPAPQGLAATANGTLILVDETTHVVASLAPCR
jgi:DNA-binding beta-propeller fold protein YncE